MCDGRPQVSGFRSAPVPMSTRRPGRRLRHQPLEDSPSLSPSASPAIRQIVEPSTRSAVHAWRVSLGADRRQHNGLR